MPNDKTQMVLEEIKHQATISTRDSLAYKLPKKLFLQNKRLDDSSLVDLIQFLHEEIEDGEVLLADGTKASKRWGDDLEELHLGNMNDETNANVFCNFQIRSEESVKHSTPGLAKLKILKIQSTGAQNIELKLTNLTQLDASNNKIYRFAAQTPKLGSCILNHNLLEYFDASAYKKLHTLYINSNKLRYLHLSNPKLTDLFMLANPLTTLFLNDTKPIMMLCDLNYLDDISRARLSKICKKISNVEEQINNELAANLVQELEVNDEPVIVEDNNHEQPETPINDEIIEAFANQEPEPDNQDIEDTGAIVLDYEPIENITPIQAWDACALVRKRQILAQIHINNIREQSAYEHLHNCLIPYIHQQMCKDLLLVCSIMNSTNGRAQTTDKNLNGAADIIKLLPAEIGLKILCSYLYGEQIEIELKKAIDDLDKDIQNNLQFKIKTEELKIISFRIVSEMQQRFLQMATKLLKQQVKKFSKQEEENDRESKTTLEKTQKEFESTTAHVVNRVSSPCSQSKGIILFAFNLKNLPILGENCLPSEQSVPQRKNIRQSFN